MTRTYDQKCYDLAARKRPISIREFNRQSEAERDPNSLRNRLRRIAESEAKEAIKILEKKYGRG